LELLRLGQTSTRFQPKLTVSTPGDPLEDEADRIADAVVGDSSFIAVPRSAAPAVQRRDDETKPPDPASQPARAEQVPKFGVEVTPKETQERALKEAAATLGSYLWDLFAKSDVGQHVLRQNLHDMRRIVQFFQDAASSLAGKVILGGAAAGAAGGAAAAAWGMRETPAQGSAESHLPKDEKYFELSLKWDFITLPASFTLKTPWLELPEVSIGKKKGAQPNPAAPPATFRVTESVPRICTPADPRGDRGKADEQSAFIYWWLLRNRELAEKRLQQLANPPQLHAPKMGPSVLNTTMFKRWGGVTADADPAALEFGLRSSPNELDRDARTFMEARFGRDFSQVRIHSDASAAASADALGAEAFTHGQHIVFAQGRYSPATVTGRRLLAHELAHVVQQQGPRDLRSAVMRRGRTVGGFFANIFQAWDYSKGSLDGYLQILRNTNQIEGDDDSDDKARQVVEEWKQDKTRFQLTPQVKVLLVREMLDGVVSKADQEGIMDLLEGSSSTDLKAVFQVLTVSEMSDRFSSQRARLKLFSERVVQSLKAFGPLDPGDAKTLQAGLQEIGDPLGAEITNLFATFSVAAGTLKRSTLVDVLIPTGGMRVEVGLTPKILDIRMNPGLVLDVIAPFSDMTLTGFRVHLRGLALELDLFGNRLLEGMAEDTIHDLFKDLLVGTRFADPNYNALEDPQLLGEAMHQDRVGDINRIKYNLERLPLKEGKTQPAAADQGKKDDQSKKGDQPKKDGEAGVGLKDLSQFIFGVGVTKKTRFAQPLARGYEMAVEPDTKFWVSLQVAANAEQLKQKDAQLIKLHVKTDGILLNKGGKKVAALKSLSIHPGLKLSLDEVEVYADIAELVRKEAAGEWYSGAAEVLSRVIPDESIKRFILWYAEGKVTSMIRDLVGEHWSRIKDGAGVSDQQIERFFGLTRR
jgi:hypothetical protein